MAFRGHRSIAAISTLAAAALAAAAPAAADTGSLAFQDCVSSNTNVLPCAPIAGAVAGGGNTGLDGLRDVEVSADGKSVIAGSEPSAALSTFDRDASTGALTYTGCISSNDDVTGCTLLPDAGNNGSGTGMGGLASLTTTEDAESVYTASQFTDAVTRFDRDPATGALTYRGCITSDTATTACTPIAEAAATGAGTPMNRLRGIAASDDGRSVYAVSADSATIVRFSRDPATGAIAFADCITARNATSPCAAIPGSTANGAGTPLASLFAVDVSPDGKSVYTAAFDGFAVATFDRDTETGALSYAGCLTSKASVTGCTLVPGADNSNDTSLSNATGVTVSPDNRSVYVAAEDASSVVSFDRDTSSGAIAYRDCVTSETEVTACTQLPGSTSGGVNAPLTYPEDVVVSPDGLNVYAASLDGSVVRFDRDLASGALSFNDCLTSNSNVVVCRALSGATAGGTGTGLSELLALDVSSDGANLYSAAEFGDAVARFDREPAPSNEFSFGNLKRNKRKGTAKLTIAVPGAGAVVLGGGKVKAAQRRMPTGGSLKLKIKAKGKTAKRLRNRGKAKVTAEVTFTPDHGIPKTKAKKLKLIQK